MEQFIILLIWLGMGLFGLFAKARNKKREGESGQPQGDWLDDQWQELIHPQEDDEAVVQLPAPTRIDTPPPLPPSAPVQPPHRPVSASTWSPATPGQPLVATPAVMGGHLPTEPRQASLDGKIAPRSIQRRYGKRHTTVHDLLGGKESLRRAMLLREVIDRPRAYDV